MAKTKLRVSIEMLQFFCRCSNDPKYTHKYLVAEPLGDEAYKLRVFDDKAEAIQFGDTLPELYIQRGMQPFYVNTAEEVEAYLQRIRQIPNVIGKPRANEERKEGN